MIKELNLLPPTRRRFIDQQVTLNIVVKIVNRLIVALLVLTCGGLLSLGGLYTATAVSGRGASSELKLEIERYQAKREEIARQNAALKLLYDLSTAPVVWSEILPELLAVLPAGTTINKMAGDQFSTARLDFQGRATSRSSLIAFTERLNKLPWVASFTAPHSNLIDRINPDYSFSIVINQKFLREKDE